MSRLFGGIRQLAMVVHDADATMKTLTETLGIGPFLCIREVEMKNYRYRGRPSPAPVVSLCFGQSGELQIEIIQQHNDAPSAYTEFLGAGKEGCQYIATWYDDRAAFDRDYEQALSQGMTLVHEGEGGEGENAARFA